MGLSDQLFDLMNCLDLLRDEVKDDGSPELFPQDWLSPHLSYTGLLEAKGLRFDAIVRSLFCAAQEFRYITDNVRCHGGWRRDPYGNIRSLWGGGGG